MKLVSSFKHFFFEYLKKNITEAEIISLKNRQRSSNYYVNSILTGLIFIFCHLLPSNSCLMRRSRIAKRMSHAEWVPALLLSMVAFCLAAIGIDTVGCRQGGWQIGKRLHRWHRNSNCLLISLGKYSARFKQVAFQCVVSWKCLLTLSDGVLLKTQKWWPCYHILYLLWNGDQM